MRSQCVAHNMQIKMSKVKVTQVIWNFCHVCSVASSLFDQISSYVANIQHMKGWCAMPHFQDERSMVKVTQVISSFGPVHSVASSLFGWITSYVAYIQHMSGRCVSHIIFWIKCQRSRSHELFKVFTMFAPWLPHLTKSLHIWHTYNTWGCDVSRTICCHLAALWFHVYLTVLWRLWVDGGVHSY